MAALNYYIGVKRGADEKLDKIVAGTASAGTAVDIELNMQINNGTNATGLTQKDVVLALSQFKQYITSGGIQHKGQFLPPL